jgi:hypothetical protein
MVRKQIYEFRRAVANTQETDDGGGGGGGGGSSGGGGAESMYGTGGNGKLAARFGQQQQQQQQQQEPVTVEAVEMSMGTAPALPEGWSELSDPSTGKAYYHNMFTNETTWERPAPVLADHLSENATGKLYGSAKGWAKERGVAKFTPQHRAIAGLGRGGSGAAEDDGEIGDTAFI